MALGVPSVLSRIAIAMQPSEQVWYARLVVACCWVAIASFTFPSFDLTNTVLYLDNLIFMAAKGLFGVSD